MSKKRERPQRSGLTGMSETQRIIEQGRQQQEALQSDGRGQAGHGGELGKDKRGQEKATYYLPIHRQKLVRAMAEGEEVGQSDIVELAVVGLYNAWRAGKIDLSEMKTATKSLRVLWKLDVPDEFDFFSDDTQP